MIEYRGQSISSMPERRTGTPSPTDARSPGPLPADRDPFRDLRRAHRPRLAGPDPPDPGLSGSENRTCCSCTILSGTHNFDEVVACPMTIVDRLPQSHPRAVLRDEAFRRLIRLGHEQLGQLAHRSLRRGRRLQFQPTGDAAGRIPAGRGAAGPGRLSPSSPGTPPTLELRRPTGSTSGGSSGTSASTTWSRPSPTMPGPSTPRRGSC